MWENYTETIKKSTPNIKSLEVEYGICLNKVPDYIVAIEVNSLNNNDSQYFCWTIPKTNNYLKVTFNAQNRDELLNETLPSIHQVYKKYAKENKISINRDFTIEVYPKSTINNEHPEMYLLIPIK